MLKRRRKEFPKTSDEMEDVGQSQPGDAGSGVLRGTVRLSDYDSDWQRLFETERTRLQHIFGETAPIEHIGSTAVPGLRAKPLIDIALQFFVHEIDAEKLASLEILGYERRPAKYFDPDKHWVFAKGYGEHTQFLIHVLDPADRQWGSYLQFRDVLRADEATRQEYVRLKISLARQFPNDREAYTAGKDVFIRTVLENFLLL